MSTTSRELPMAPADCTLDDHALAVQLDRYQRLGRTAISIHSGGREVHVRRALDVRGSSAGAHDLGPFAPGPPGAGRSSAPDRTPSGVPP